MKYDELVKALRCGEYKLECGSSDCPYWRSCIGCLDLQLMEDAAAAIQALQAELEKKRTADCWGCKCEKLEPKRGEIVRCKECKWYQKGYDINGKWFSRCNGSVRTYGHTPPDWYCADGEREVQE